MDQTPQIDQEQMEEMTFSSVDLDLLLQMFESETKDASLPAIATPVVECDPQQPQTDCHMPLGGAPFSLQQPVMPAPGFHAAQTGLPHPPPHGAPANGGFGPQQPQTDCHMPLGGAPFSLQQPVMPAPGFHAAQTGLPHPPPHGAPANGGFGPQQPQTDCHMPLGGAPFSLQQPVMPAPGLAPPMYWPPTILSNYMFPQAAPFGHWQVNNRPVVTHPQGLGMNLAPFGFKNGEMVYGAPAYTAPPVASDVPVVEANASKKKKCYSKARDESKPYVKKPPNAFMVYRMEMRPKVVAELKISECATVNKVIGQRWRSLSKEEQAVYYQRAKFEKQLHSQLFPDWSPSDNYGKKRKRIRKKCLNTDEIEQFELSRE